MPIARVNFDQIPYLGAFALGTDKIVLLPGLFHVREKAVGEAMKVPVGRARMEASPLLGVLAVANSNGFLCSDLFSLEEEKFESYGIEVVRVPGRFTAFGNLVLANDRGALVNPDLPDEILDGISEGLKVPVERGTIAGIKSVGAAGVATNRGALVHPDASQGELELASKVLGVHVETGTACGGEKYVGLCVVANSNGAIVGTSTTGPELGRVESALGFV